MVRQGDKRRMFNWSRTSTAPQKIAEVGNVVLIFITPVSAYMGVGKVDSTGRPMCVACLPSAGNCRGMMRNHRHHALQQKSDVTDAMLRIADSLAYVAASRHAYVVLR